MARRPDIPSLVAGAVIALLGVVVLLDRADVLDLRFAALGPLACAALGAILLASGLARRDQ
ncbi:MAG TPA: hypothetical protein VHF51_07200 [Solirubrobacteraceae bacterium]|nr:hypothetical protein [Solirubrobacteraceae bacterium]